MSEFEPKSLDEIRGEIDKLDEQIQELLNQRFKLAEDVIKTKLKDDDFTIFQPKREEEILDKVKERNLTADCKVSEEDIVDLFKKIMSISRKIQKSHTENPPKPKE